MNRQHRLLVVAAVAALASLAWYAASLDTPDEPWPAPLDDQQFWAMVQRFSEPDGTFSPKGGYRSDNLVSNERSLQQIMPALLQARRSGAYLGVGPEQNFTYITALEPSIAFVIDIRRENLLLHLMYKALAEESVDRVDFLSRLFARARPSGLGPNSSIESMFAAFELSPRSAELEQRTLRTIVQRLGDAHGFQLSPEDEAGIAAVYSKFAEAGPRIRWDLTGGSWIPSYAELMAQADSQGHQRSYLASEETFEVFRRYQLHNRIVPLVGNFGGTTTLRAVSRYLASQDTVVAAFYTSNVEVYLGDALQQFVTNVTALPRDEHSVFIRTRFNFVGFTRGREDYKTTTSIEPMREYLDSWRTPEAQ